MTECNSSRIEKGFGADVDPIDRAHAAISGLKGYVFAVDVVINSIVEDGILCDESEMMGVYQMFETSGFFFIGELERAIEDMNA